MTRRTAIALAAVALVVLGLILLITLSPSPVDRPYGGIIASFLASVRSVPGLSWFDYDDLERGANVIMFVPLAAVLTRIVGPTRWWLVVIGCALLSCGVEAFQYLFLPERTASIIDVATNTAGALVGAGLAALIIGRKRNAGAG